MFDLDASLEKQLTEAGGQKQTLVFPEPDDPRVLNAASRLIQFANVILVGGKKEIVSLLDHGAVELACSRDRFFERVRIVDPKAQEAMRREMAAELAALGKGRKWGLSPEEAAAKVLEPVAFGVMLVRCGYADAVLGGVAHSTRDFLIPCLRFLEGEGTAFEMGLFALPDEADGPLFDQNIVMFADVALNMEPTPAQLADIAVGACQTLRDIIPAGVLPEITGALVSYSTRGSGAGSSVERIRQAEPLIREKLAVLQEQKPEYRTINVLSELQISVAISPEAAKVKLKDQFEILKGAGKANVLIVPSLDEGNMLYHLYNTRYPAAQSTLIMGGMKHQALDFSRGSTPRQIARGALVLLLSRLRSAHFRPTPKDIFFPRHRILTVNPGSTTTKLGLYEGESALFLREIAHDALELAHFPDSLSQIELRRRLVDQALLEEGAELSSVEAVVGRAGLLPGMSAGAYLVDGAMLEALKKNPIGDHAANLGAFLADTLAKRAGVAAYVTDAPTVDERDETARTCGLPGVSATSVWHALSQKAAARKYAESQNKSYQDCNLVVAHLGGGISVGAHRRGRCVEVNNALYDGPMAPSRAGRVPSEVLLELCYAGQSRDRVCRLLTRQGGMVSHLGTADMIRVMAEAEAGEPRARLAVEAMALQICREIASLTPVFRGEAVDRIIITGGLARSQALMDQIQGNLAALAAGLSVYPGSLELEALRDAGIRVLDMVEEPKNYTV